MDKLVGVLILHGVGVQEAGYSAPLIVGIKSKLNGLHIDVANIEFNEVVYSDIFGDNQQKRSEFLMNTSSIWQLITRIIRKILIFVLSDAVSYRARYKTVHKRLSENIEKLQSVLVKDAPIIVVAHSMGVMAISDYIYDEQQGIYSDLNLAKIVNLKALITFGCNIPLFEMGYENTVCIKRPQSDVEEKTFFWKNYYSPFDVLGYRVDGYYKDKPAPNFKMLDIRIFPGGIFRSWNILSHTSYWTHAGIHESISKTISNCINLGRLRKHKKEVSASSVAVS